MRHFKSKEGLFLAVLKEKQIQTLRGISFTEHDSLEEELVHYGRARLKADWEAEDFLRMLLSQFIAEDELAKRVRKTLFQDEFCSGITGRLVHFQSKGQIHKSYSIEDASMLIDKQIFITFMIHILLIRTGLAEAQRQLELAMRTVARGLQKR